MQVELQGENYQKLHSISSRRLNFVWPCRYAKVFGILPKALGSHWIILNRRTICFSKVILVYHGVNRCAGGGAEWVKLPEDLRVYYSQSMCDMMRGCPREWREVEGVEWNSEEKRSRNPSQLQIFALGDLADCIASYWERECRTKLGLTRDIWNRDCIWVLCCIAAPSNEFSRIWLRGDSWPGTKLYFRC